MMKREKKIHHEARRYGDGIHGWRVSDCYHTDYQGLKMTTDWEKVTCKNCLKDRPK